MSPEAQGLPRRPTYPGAPGKALGAGVPGGPLRPSMSTPPTCPVRTGPRAAHIRCSSAQEAVTPPPGKAVSQGQLSPARGSVLSLASVLSFAAVTCMLALRVPRGGLLVISLHQRGVCIQRSEASASWPRVDNARLVASPGSLPSLPLRPGSSQQYLHPCISFLPRCCGYSW